MSTKAQYHHVQFWLALHANNWITDGLLALGLIIAVTSVTDPPHEHFGHVTTCFYRNSTDNKEMRTEYTIMLQSAKIFTFVILASHDFLMHECSKNVSENTIDWYSKVWFHTKLFLVLIACDPIAKMYLFLFITVKPVQENAVTKPDGAHSLKLSTRD